MQFEDLNQFQRPQCLDASLETISESFPATNYETNKTIVISHKKQNSQSYIEQNTKLLKNFLTRS